MRDCLSSRYRKRLRLTLTSEHAPHIYPPTKTDIAQG